MPKSLSSSNPDRSSVVLCFSCQLKEQGTPFWPDVGRLHGGSRSSLPMRPSQYEPANSFSEESQCSSWPASGAACSHQQQGPAPCFADQRAPIPSLLVASSTLACSVLLVCFILCEITKESLMKTVFAPYLSSFVRSYSIYYSISCLIVLS